MRQRKNKKPNWQNRTFETTPPNTHFRETINRRKFEISLIFKKSSVLGKIPLAAERLPTSKKVPKTPPRSGRGAGAGVPKG